MGRGRHSYFIIGCSPAPVRVMAFHCFDKLERVGSEVFLVNNPVMTHDESLYPGYPIFSGNRDQREAANHHVFDHVVEFAQGSSRALSLQHLEIVTMIGSS